MTFLSSISDGAILSGGKTSPGRFSQGNLRDGHHVGIRYHVNMYFLYKETYFSVCWGVDGGSSYGRLHPGKCVKALLVVHSRPAKIDQLVN